MVYLLHFARPVNRAQHCVCATSDRTTIAQLERGIIPSSDEPLVKAARDAGISITVAKLWPGGERERARLRRLKQATRFCPTCARLSQARRRV